MPPPQEDPFSVCLQGLGVSFLRRKAGEFEVGLGTLEVDPPALPLSPLPFLERSHIHPWADVVGLLSAAREGPAAPH